MKVLFINGSPEAQGNTAQLASVLLEGCDYDTVELGTTKVYDYGQHFDDDQFDQVLEQMRQADVLVLGSPVYWHDLSGMLRNLLDRCYGPVAEGEFSGKKLFLVFQGAAPTKDMLERGNYTVSRFAALYGAQYMGMATNAAEARKLSRQL